MVKYKILIKPSAVKEIDSLAKKDIVRITTKIQDLSEDPRPTGSQKLSGKNRYRVRQGNYRIVYSIEDAIRIVKVVKVGHRRDVYR